MCDAVIINYQLFSVKKILFRVKRNAEKQCFACDIEKMFRK